MFFPKWEQRDDRRTGVYPFLQALIYVFFWSNFRLGAYTRTVAQPAL
jgi:hypothetical protein